MSWSVTRGMERTRRALWWKAAGMSRCRRSWSARWLPHPGHSSPVRVRKGHRGKGVVAGSRR